MRRQEDREGKEGGGLVWYSTNKGSSSSSSVEEGITSFRPAGMIIEVHNAGERRDRQRGREGARGREGGREETKGVD